MFPLLDYEYKYSLDEDGTVTNLIRNRVVLARKTKRGYGIALQIEGQPREYFLLHILLAMQYIPKPKDKEFVSFRDGNVFNIALDNLYWLSKAELMKKRHEMYADKFKQKPDEEKERLLLQVLAGTRIREIAKLAGTSPESITGVLRVYARRTGRGEQWKQQVSAFRGVGYDQAAA